MHAIAEIKSHKSVMKRLKSMHCRFEKKELDRDPFRRTFVELMRESLESGTASRHNWMRAKFHWFAQADLRREDLAQVFDNCGYQESEQTQLNDNHGYCYSESSFEKPQPKGQTVVEEYMSFLKNLESRSTNKLSISRNADIQNEQLLLPVFNMPIRTNACAQDDLHTDKTSSELFLSVHNFVMEKEPAMEEEIGAEVAAAEVAVSEVAVEKVVVVVVDVAKSETIKEPGIRNAIQPESTPESWTQDLMRRFLITI